MRISDWSSDVCSSDLFLQRCTQRQHARAAVHARPRASARAEAGVRTDLLSKEARAVAYCLRGVGQVSAGVSQLEIVLRAHPDLERSRTAHAERVRSEEHTSELQSLLRTSYATFCSNKTIINT